LQAQVRRYDDLVTVESADADGWEYSARATFEPTQENRFRVQGTWRERQYDNGAGPATTGDGARVEAQYRRRFGAYHYLAFDLFVGTWIARRAGELGPPHLAIVPVLALTFLFGPAGLLAFFVLRAVLRPASLRPQPGTHP
jgi:hypothetical protein